LVSRVGQNRIYTPYMTGPCIRRNPCKEKHIYTVHTVFFVIFVPYIRNIRCIYVSGQPYRWEAGTRRADKLLHEGTFSPTFVQNNHNKKPLKVWRYLQLFFRHHMFTWVAWLREHQCSVLAKMVNRMNE